MHLTGSWGGREVERVSCQPCRSWERQHSWLPWNTWQQVHYMASQNMFQWLVFTNLACEFANLLKFCNTNPFVKLWYLISFQAAVDWHVDLHHLHRERPAPGFQCPPVYLQFSASQTRHTHKVRFKITDELIHFLREGVKGCVTCVCGGGGGHPP